MSGVDELAAELRHLEVALEEAMVMRAREDFGAFCEYVMIDDQGRPWKFARHQREWSDLMDRPDVRLLQIVGPRGCAKSTTVQARVLWELGRNPNLCVKYVCGSDTKAIDRLRFLRSNIMSNRRYRRVFPHVRPAEVEAEWTKHKAFIERPASAGLQDASIEASSVDSPGTGGRAHLIIFDDIIDASDALARPAVIPRVKRFVEEDWMNVLYPGGRAWMLGTFWSFDPPDIYVEYAERPEWTSWIRPACGLDAEGRICEPFLWPERWGKEQLEEQRRKVGEEAFLQQYCLRGAVQRSSYFSREHVDACKHPSIALGEVPTELVRVGIGMDPATSLRARGASMACVFVAGLLRNGLKLPLAIIPLKADPEVVCETVIEQYLLWHPDAVLVENNSSQKAFETLIRVIGEKRGLTDMPLRGRFTGEQKWSPEAGIPALNAELAQGKWIIPFKGDHTQPFHSCAVCKWISEMLYWGKLRDASGQRPTTDVIMAWWLANAALEEGRFVGDVPIVAARERRPVVYETTRYLV